MASLAKMLKAEINMETGGTPVLRLTPRQREVLAGIASGRAHKQVADEMGVAYSTFCSYRKALYKRLGVRSETEAAREYQKFLTTDQHR